MRSSSTLSASEIIIIFILEMKKFIFIKYKCGIQNYLTEEMMIRSILSSKVFQVQNFKNSASNHTEPPFAH